MDQDHRNTTALDIPSCEENILEFYTTGTNSPLSPALCLQADTLVSATGKVGLNLRGSPVSAARPCSAAAPAPAPLAPAGCSRTAAAAGPAPPSEPHTAGRREQEGRQAYKRRRF